MIEMDLQQCEATAGGFTFSQAWTAVTAGFDMVRGYGIGISALGATLSNYYGREMAVDIIAAGGMGA